MDASQHALAKLLFNEACDLPKAEQIGRLRALTEDAALIDYVLILLAQAYTDNPRVAQSVLRNMDDIAGEALSAGMTLGAWKLFEEIGQGGMGQVFLAQRVDGHFEQTAAIKLLHGLPSAKALEYLARERQILAGLTHANIARLYDGGATPRGRPYLVMEYVEGINIDRYVRDKQLSADAVLKLMREVCAAVSFAHQRLVIHCDIKPSNLLVTGAGRPMLLDFGIARLLETQDDNSTPVAAFSAEIHQSRDPASRSTQSKARAFTPRYASPEQQSGGALTTATDVFSLGKLLEELLMVSLKEPNNRASPAISSAENLPFDLRAIIAKATDVDAQRRYATVHGLTADIARFERHEPVKARSGSMHYVVQKFSQRHWPWLAAASIFVLSLGYATGRILMERDRAQAAEIVALNERDATKHAKDIAEGARDGAQAARRQAETARMQAEAARDRAATAEAATAQQRDRAQAAEASALRERDRAKAAETAALAERNRATQAEANAVQTNDFLISVFRSGEPTAKAGNVPVSVLLEKAETRLDSELKGQPQVQARLYSTLGSLQREMAEYVNAERLHKRAIEIQRTTTGLQSALAPKSPQLENDAKLALAAQLFAQANDLYVNGKSELAIVAAQEALALREKYAAEKSLDVGQSVSQVGQIFINVGKLEESTPLLERGLAIIDAVAPEGEEMAFALANFAWQRHRLGDSVRAEALGLRALALRVKQGGSIDAPYAIKQREDLSQIIASAGRHAEAEVLMQQTIAQRTVLHGRANMRVANGLQRLAVFLVAQDRASEAIPLYTESREIMVKTASTELPHYRAVNLNLGIAYLRVGDIASASAPLQLAVDYTRKFVEVEGDKRLINNLCVLADVLTKLGQLSQARERALEALGYAKRSTVEPKAKLATALVQLIDLETNAGNLAEAENYVQQVESLQESFALEPGQIAMLARAKARSAARRGDIAQALQAYIAAQPLWDKHYGTENSAAWLEKMALATLLIERGTSAQKVEGQDLAQKILAKAELKLAPTSPVLKALNRLVVTVVPN